MNTIGLVKQSVTGLHVHFIVEVVTCFVSPNNKKKLK